MVELKFLGVHPFRTAPFPGIPTFDGRLEFELCFFWIDLRIRTSKGLLLCLISMRNHFESKNGQWNS